MTLNNVIFCLSFGMLSCGFISETFAKVLDQKEADALVKAEIGVRKQTELNILAKDGYTEIADEAFQYLPENDLWGLKFTPRERRLSKILTLRIPGTVKNIGKSAFEYLPKLQEINIDEGVDVIGDLAFFGCKSVNKISIPRSVRTIGEKAFAGCKTLTEINIPNTILDMKKYAFANCTSLKKATFQDGDQENWKLKYIHGTFLGCTSLQDVRLPNTLEILGMHTFCECKMLQSIIIPNSVKSIHYGAFKECKNLTEVTMYGSIMSIENNIFEGCHNLKVIKVLGVTDKPNQERIAELLKRSGMPIGTTIKFDSKQVTLRNRSESTTINKRNSEPANLWSNSNYQDDNKPEEQNILPVESSGKKDSKSNKSKGASHKKSKSASNYQDDNKPKEQNILPVESSSMKDSTSKKSKTHSRSKSTDHSTTNYVDTSSNTSKSFNGVTSSRSSIQSNVKMPKFTDQPYGNVLTRNIVYATLKQDFVIPEGYTTIEPRAFEGRNVVSITIPKSMTVIGQNAFSGCTSLKTVIIHSKVTAIDANAFTGCQDVAVEVIIANNTTQQDLDNIAKIFKQTRFNGGISRYYSKDMRTINESANGTLTNYIITNQLKHNNGELFIPNGYTDIEANAFSGQLDITSIKIPESMKVIGPNAFSGCTSLKTVIIHSKVTSIDANAFTGCQDVAVEIIIDNKTTQQDLNNIAKIFKQTRFNGGISRYYPKDMRK